MTSKKEVNLRRLTRANDWVGFVVFGLAFLSIIIIMAAAATAFFSYILETKIQKEYMEVERLVKVYEENSDKQKEDLYALLDRDKRVYYIADAETGELCHNYGEIELFDDDDLLPINTLNENLSFYSKNEVEFLRYNDDDRVSVDFMDLVKHINLEALEGTSFQDLDENFMELPVWVRIPVRENSEYFYGRITIALGLRDFVYVVILSGMVAIILLIVLIVMIVTAVVNAVRKRKTINLLFTDIITKGHNWLWFVYKGNQIIRKKKNRNRSYAVVNIEMVKYANFCVCHSLTEGEDTLRKVSIILSKNILKNELCAHASSASFALLLKYSDEEKIKRRITHIIEQLSLISSEHKFCFHAGIAVVDSQKTGELDKKGRAIIDIEKEYHYASAAKETLAASDESGVAILDDKLIEEQKWVDLVSERQKSALENEEFVVFYQPKYNPQTNELSGAEALIRWQSPEFGFVTPNRFIPIFEQNGFITEIDHYMVRHVARDQRRWIDAGYGCVPVSVNVSRAHFVEDDLAEQIRDMVDLERCPHEFIEIELTESAFFDDKKAMVNTINKLKNFGFAVSMDDFGSGYSSLNSLKDMPLDVLKLDAEFFRGDSEDGRGEIVVREAIRLAKCLNMRTVAEGVEIKEQVDFLADQGCDMIQGYYFAKPMTGDEYEKRMKNTEESGQDEE